MDAGPCDAGCSGGCRTGCGEQCWYKFSQACDGGLCRVSPLGLELFDAGWVRVSGLGAEDVWLGDDQRRLHHLDSNGWSCVELTSLRSIDDVFAASHAVWAVGEAAAQSTDL